MIRGGRAVVAVVAATLLVVTAHIGYLHSVKYLGDSPVIRRDPARGEPLVVRIPAVKVDAAVRSVSSADDGVLSPPTSIWEVGWWSGGALPGSARGTVLMTAHTYRGDDGVFGHLGGLVSGDWVHILTREGTVDYRVDEVLDLSEEEFSEQADELLAEDARGRLVLVTCGRYHFGHYAGRTVVNATLVPKR